MIAAETALLIATAVAAAGTVYQGQQAKKQADFQAEVQRQQAQREREIAAAQEGDFRRGQGRLMARRRAMMGGSGVEQSTGSPLLVSEDLTGETELQALRIRNGGETSATRLEQQAMLTSMAGNSARTASFFQAGSSLFHGFSKVDFKTKKKNLGHGQENWASP